MAAYFVFHNRIHDAEKMQEYIPKAIATLAPYNVEILAVDEHAHVIEGHTDWPRTIVVKFDSREAALAWYNSPEYEKVRQLRLDATDGVAVLVDGVSATGH